MKVGDMIRNKTRYRIGKEFQKFLVVEIRDKSVAELGLTLKQLRAIRMPDGLRTRWSAIDGWEVISESR